MQLDEEQLDDLCERVQVTPSCEALECLMILRDYYLERGDIADESAAALDRWQRSNAACIGDAEVVLARMRREAERTELGATWRLARINRLKRLKEAYPQRVRQARRRLSQFMGFPRTR